MRGQVNKIGGVGKLSPVLLRPANRVASNSTYVARFGSLVKSYELIGCQSPGYTIAGLEGRRELAKRKIVTAAVLRRAILDHPSLAGEARRIHIGAIQILGEKNPTLWLGQGVGQSTLLVSAMGFISRPSETRYRRLQGYGTALFGSLLSRFTSPVNHFVQSQVYTSWTWSSAPM
jgi:hypothetical protein